MDLDEELYHDPDHCPNGHDVAPADCSQMGCCCRCEFCREAAVKQLVQDCSEVSDYFCPEAEDDWPPRDLGGEG